MKIKDYGAKYSSIVGIGEMIKDLENKTNNKYLYLNRGINSVVNIDLENIIPMIDFNSTDIQVYPPNSGILPLKKSINDEYFYGESDPKNIFIVNGGMSGLDLIMKTLDIKKLYSYQYYWGAYLNILKINGIGHGTYVSYESIYDNIDEYKGNAVIICDPNNPIGNKYNDDKLLDIINILDSEGIITIFDSPYRKIFTDDDTLYEELLSFKNVIITDSFSKSLGLSGQRIGFVHSLNEDFNNMFNINLLYATNGINAFSQHLIHKLLSTKDGEKSIMDFKLKTREHIKKNIDFLKDKDLLADELYLDSFPMGIFVVVNRSFDDLLKHNIGSVPMSFFTKNEDIINKNYSRICVSVDHDIFKEFFEKLIM